MNATIRILLGVGLVALIASPASAQGRGGFFRGNVAMLLGNESVQKELKLDDSQVEKAKELSGKLREKMTENREAVQGLEGEERMTKMRELNREIAQTANKSMGEFMKPEQVKRMHQIVHQQQGAMAFNNPEVATKLNLTDDQKKEIQEVSQAQREKFQGLREEFQNDREGAMKKMQEIQKETLTQIEAKLNDEQRKAWKEMLGAPFEIKYEQN